MHQHGLPIRDSVYFSDARNLFDAAGTLLVPAYIRRVDDMLAELTWYARALRWGRDTLIYFFSTGHYRQPLQYTDTALLSAQERVRKIRSLALPR